MLIDKYIHDLPLLFILHTNSSENGKQRASQVNVTGGNLNKNRSNCQKNSRQQIRSGSNSYHICRVGLKKNKTKYIHMLLWVTSAALTAFILTVAFLIKHTHTHNHTRLRLWLAVFCSFSLLRLRANETKRGRLCKARSFFKITDGFRILAR